ncbi:MAG: F0F1 ATP synthase subunit A [bacterium]
MQISPDTTIFWESGFFKLNATIVFTWGVMAVIILISWLATRNIKVDTPISRWQNLLETIVKAMREQIEDVFQQKPDIYLPFLGTLFLFISISNLLDFIPGYTAPTGSLSTTAALAGCVFFAVPVFGIIKKGVGSYLKNYIQPSPFMLPFNIIGELSRTLALAVRLFGNIMSGSMIVAILLSVAPLFIPIVMQALGILIGQIQAYIFAVLAAVYIASATRVHEKEEE